MRIKRLYPFQISLLEAGVEGGPELTAFGTADAGIHLRRFYAWTSPEKARSELAALSFTDGGDRSASLAPWLTN